MNSRSGLVGTLGGRGTLSHTYPVDNIKSGSLGATTRALTQTTAVDVREDLLSPSAQAEVALKTELGILETWHRELQTKKAGQVPSFIMQQAMLFAYAHTAGPRCVPGRAGCQRSRSLGAKKQMDLPVTLKVVDELVADYKYNGMRIQIVDPLKLGFRRPRAATAAAQDLGRRSSGR